MNKNISCVQIGYSETDITPRHPMELVGFSRPDNLSRGVLHPLYAQVLVWKNGKDAGCLITIDSIGFTVTLTNRLRALAADAIGQKSQNVMVCFSHTHAAPDAAKEPDYYAMVCERVLSALYTAKKQSFPARAAWGIAENTIGVNRRKESCRIDSRLGVLMITEDRSDRPRLLLLRVTAHANVLSSDNYDVSPDYFGAARDWIKKQYACGVMIVQGAAGNIRPKYRQDNAEYLEIHSLEAAKEKQTPQHRAQSLAALEQMAKEIGQALGPVIQNAVPTSIERIAMFSKHLPFYADVPTPSRALEIAEEAEKECGIDGAPWLREVHRLREAGVLRQTASIELAYFIVNDGALCGVPNEAMCEIALDIQAQTSPFLFFGGYVNGIDSYLASAEEYKKGGYEVLWSNLLFFKSHGRVMPLNKSTASDLARAAADLWLDFIEKQPPSL